METSTLTGRVLRPDDSEYEQEKAGFNLAVDHHPALIVAAADADEVRAAVRHAEAEARPVAVQATGHGATLAADGTVMISTRRMDGVRIDPVQRTARVEAGVRWHQVIDKAAEHELAPLNGSSPLVGAVSYTLGGGLPVLGRTFGWAADHVRAIDVVTADGRLHSVTHGHELFWALRGGKGNFGVVTSMEFDLFPVSRLYGGGLFFPGEAARDVLHTWRDWTVSAPDELNSSLALLRLPDIPAIPAALRGRFIAHIRVAYVGPPETGEELVRPLRAIGPRIIDTVADMPYRDIAQVHNDPDRPAAYDERSLMLRDLDGPAIDVLLGPTGPITMVEIRHLGGALGRPPGSPNAVGHRDAAYSLSTVGPDPAPAETLLRRMAPWGTGRRFLNFLGGPGTAGLTREAYEPDVYTRLAALKATYDPVNLFRLNHNIPPAR